MAVRRAGGRGFGTLAQLYGPHFSSGLASRALGSTKGMTGREGSVGLECYEGKQGLNGGTWGPVKAWQVPGRKRGTGGLFLGDPRILR